MPRYSAVSVGATPAVKTASTSRVVSPASPSALNAASACSCSADLLGTSPIWSDSATPTMATLPESSSEPAISTLRPGAQVAAERLPLLVRQLTQGLADRRARGPLHPGA